MKPKSLERMSLLTRALCWLVILLVPSLSSGQQPDSATNAATIQALLVEVRQLRVAMERSTTIMPRLQLAIARFQMQQERVDRLEREYRTFHAQFVSDFSGKERLTASLKHFELQAAQSQDPATRKQIEEAAGQIKSELEQQSLREPQEQAQEIEMASQLKAEQAKLSELSEQLNQLDKKMQ